MKRVFLIISLIILMPCIALASDFLGAPIHPDGKILMKKKGRLEFVVPKRFDDVVNFYRQSLSREKDIRFRDWKNAIYIEDDGALKWHSITIYRDDKQGTKVVIIKDNWTWIMGTLFLRFIGVFCVLIFLYIALSISGGILSRILGGDNKEKK